MPGKSQILNLGFVGQKKLPEEVRRRIEGCEEDELEDREPSYRKGRLEMLATGIVAWRDGRTSVW